MESREVDLYFTFFGLVKPSVALYFESVSANEQQFCYCHKAFRPNSKIYK